MDTQTQIPVETAWETMMSDLRQKVGEEVFSSWFHSAQLTGMENGKLQFSVPQAYMCSLIIDNYTATIQECWPEDAPSFNTIEITPRNGINKVGKQQPKPTPEPEVREIVERNGASHPVTSKEKTAIESSLDTRYTFATFVEGPANRLVLGVIRHVAESLTSVGRYNPLFVWSAAGMGKTHLLQAAAKEASKYREHRKVVYLSAQEFMGQFSTAMRWEDKIKDIDILLLDDIQFLQAKSIREEFSLLVSFLLDNAKKLVVTANCSPLDLEWLDSRTRSRLNSGAVLEISPPDYDTRLAILKQRLSVFALEHRSLNCVPASILEHIAHTVTGGGRELEGAINQLLFLPPESFKVEEVDRLITHLVQTDGIEKKVRIEDIQRVVARHYNVSKDELLSNRRTRTVVKPRQVAMYLSKTMTPRSLPEIGRRFGGRDHTTVLHAVRKIEGLRKDDDNLSQEIELLKRLILNEV